MAKQKNTKSISDTLKNAMSDEDIIQRARLYGFDKISHPMNIAEGVLPRQKMTVDQILREMGITKKDKNRKELDLLKKGERPLLAEYKEQLKKELRNNIKDNAEAYLGGIFNNKHYIDADKKARLALDILKATDKEYNQSTNNTVTVNLQDLPLGEGLVEAQRKIILELGITQDIFSQLNDE